MGSTLDVELHHRLSRIELDVELAVGDETLALVGPSGAGKTTILGAIAGLVRPHRGTVVASTRVLLDTEHGVFLPPEERRVGTGEHCTRDLAKSALLRYIRVERSTLRGDAPTTRLRRALGAGAGRAR